RRRRQLRLAAAERKRREDRQVQRQHFLFECRLGESHREVREDDQVSALRRRGGHSALAPSLPLLALLALVALCLPAAAHAQSFPDNVGDSGTAPDITAVELTLANGRLTFKIDVPSEPTLLSDSNAFLRIDTDANLQTGGKEQDGAEVLLNLFGENGSSNSWLWDDGRNDYIRHTFRSLTVTYSTAPIFSFDSAEIGNPKRINFWASTSRGTSYEYGTQDWAPDLGEYSFTLQASTAINLDDEPTPPVPRAGHRFHVAAIATLADSGDVVQPDSISCRSVITNGRPLAGHGGGCTWQIPRNANGRKLVVTLAVTYQGKRTVKVVRFRVR